MHIEKVLNIYSGVDIHVSLYHTRHGLRMCISEWRDCAPDPPYGFEDRVNYNLSFEVRKSISLIEAKPYEPLNNGYVPTKAFQSLPEEL